MSFVCRICGNSQNNQSYDVYEMMLGTKDKFTYFKCSSCGCLQISDFPDNVSEYYPENYYSYDTYHKLNRTRKLRSWIDRHRVNDALYHSDLQGKLANLLSKPLDYIPYLKPIWTQKTDAILDIGCGTGRLLQRMSMGGFTDLTGLDPFIAEDISYDSGVKIFKSSIEDFCSRSAKKYNIIMMHHSYEHMPEPLEILCEIHKILDSNGHLILRVPLVDSYAWEKYREKWVQLDAPRHFFLHSRKSIEYLLGKSGFALEKVIYDSSKFQFTGSELYVKDIPLSASKERKAIFSKDTIREFEQQAMNLNQKENGDQAIFYIKASNG